MNDALTHYKKKIEIIQKEKEEGKLYSVEELFEKSITNRFDEEIQEINRLIQTVDEAKEVSLLGGWTDKNIRLFKIAIPLYNKAIIDLNDLCGKELGNKLLTEDNELPSGKSLWVEINMLEDIVEHQLSKLQEVSKQKSRK